MDPKGITYMAIGGWRRPRRLEHGSRRRPGL
jgi:hypothetical protein